jgi:hypothetical protein
MDAVGELVNTGPLAGDCQRIFDGEEYIIPYRPRS